MFITAVNIKVVCNVYEDALLKLIIFKGLITEMIQESAQEDITLGVGESISAAVDGEINDLDLRRVLKKSADSAVREKWRRSHLIGAAIRGELNERNHIDISAGVWAALEDEAPLSVTSETSRFSNWYSLAAKSAVAASVAVGLLVGMQYLPSNTGGQNPGAETIATTEQLPASPITESIPAGFDAPRVNARVVSTDPNRNRNRNVASSYSNEPFVLPVSEAPRSASDPKVQAYLNNLLLIHAQQSSQASVIGVLPYVRVLYPTTKDDE